MMKILILGDTHAQDDIFLRILSVEKDYDVLLHTGDFEGSELVYRELSDTPLYYVAGNNDFFTDAPYERVIELETCRIFMTHGHRYELEKGYAGVCKAALRHKASIAVFGHSHMPVAEYSKGVLMLNPGSTAWPRQENRMASYIVLTVESGRAVSYEIRYLDKKFKIHVDNRGASNYNNTCI